MEAIYILAVTWNVNQWYILLICAACYHVAINMHAGIVTTPITAFHSFVQKRCLCVSCVFNTLSMCNYPTAILLIDIMFCKKPFSGIITYSYIIVWIKLARAFIYIRKDWVYNFVRWFSHLKVFWTSERYWTVIVKRQLNISSGQNKYVSFLGCMTSLTTIKAPVCSRVFPFGYCHCFMAVWEIT